MKLKLLLIFLFVNFTVAAQTNEELTIELDAALEILFEDSNFPGLSACIVKDNQVIWSKALGMANIATETPVTLETEFTLASISKLFTATACALLSEEGVLDLDEDINAYLPIEIINPNFPATPITVRQLLRHKSSLADYESDLQLWDEIGDPIYSLETFCEEYFIEEGTLYNENNWGTSAPESSSYWYSNAGYTLLGYIVESASEMPFNEYVESNILTPLGMNTAGWFYADVDQEDVAMPYSGSLIPYGYYSVPEYPAAMLKCNVLELANFLMAYTQHGNFEDNTLFSEEMFDQLVPEDMTNGFGWWGTDTWWGDPSGNFWSHGGYMNGVRTQLNYYPTDSTGLIILTNGEGGYTDMQNTIESYIPLFQDEIPESIFDVKEISIQVYPNPASDQLTVDLGTTNRSNTWIEILDSQNRICIRQKANHSLIKLDLTGINPGIYYLRYISEATVFQKAIIISR